MGQPSVNLGNLLSAVQRLLNGSVASYSFVIGGDGIAPTKYSWGQARTPANGLPVPFESSTRTNIGSVSKFLTAIAAVQLLDTPAANNLDSVMWPWLPKDWAVRDDAKPITFRNLLTHTAGLPHDGPGADYFSLKSFMTSEASPLGPLGVTAYSNLGFCLFRLLLPKLASLVQDDPSVPEQKRADAYALAYEQLVREKVFGPLGVTGPSTQTPEDNEHAWSYHSPDTSGYDWSTYTYPGQVWPSNGQPLIAGAGCWWVSIDEITALLGNINNLLGNVLSLSQWQTMQGIGAPAGYQNSGLGIDILVHPQNGQYRWVEKNGGDTGGDSTGGGVYTASIAFFGSMEPEIGSNGPLYAALFLNSDISGPGGDNSWFWCSQCATLASPKNGGACPATGKGHSSGGNYVISSAQKPGGQGNWRKCSKCGALCYEPSATDPSKCPADGQRHACTGETFVVTQVGKGTLQSQANWRWCKNCGVLAFSGGNSDGGKCAAGGPHQFILSGSNYALLGNAADAVLADAFLEAIM